MNIFYGIIIIFTIFILYITFNIKYYEKYQNMMDPFIYKSLNYYNIDSNIKDTKSIDNFGKFKHFSYTRRIPKNIIDNIFKQKNKNVILHQIPTCELCWNFASCKNPSKWILNKPYIENYFNIGDPLNNTNSAKFGCFQLGPNTPIIRDSGSKIIYAVEIKDPDKNTMHMISNCNECGINWCEKKQLSDDSFDIYNKYNIGKTLSQIGCNKVSKYTTRVGAGGNSKGKAQYGKRIYAVLPTK